LTLWTNRSPSRAPASVSSIVIPFAEAVTCLISATPLSEVIAHLARCEVPMVQTHGHDGPLRAKGGGRHGGGIRC